MANKSIGRPPFTSYNALTLARITELRGNQSIPCSRCDRPATVLLFDGDKLASASQLMFLCRDDLAGFLGAHPGFRQLLSEDVGEETLSHLLA